MTQKKLINLFKTLVELPSPSGEEKEVAIFISKFMKDLGWKVWTDKAGKINKSNTGNLYAYLKINEDNETIAFSAHMDTVQKKGEMIKVKFDGRIFKSDGTTILGADNKAGIASLLAAATQIKNKNLSTNILFFFPTREEAGKFGSSLFDKKSFKNIKYFFNLDDGDKPGVFIYKALGFKNFKITFKGIRAHAAKDYEKGKDAIKAAGQFISILPIGKNTKNGTTLNIGNIKAEGATNVVNDEVVLEGEYRGFSISTMESLKKTILKKAKSVEAKTGVKVKVFFDKTSSAPPFSGSKNESIVKICKKACESVNLKPKIVEGYFSLDSNYYSDLGYKTITVARGGENAHSKNEQLRLKELEKSVDLVKALIFKSS